MSISSTTNIPLTVPAWVDCGVLVAPAQTLFYIANGSGFLGVSNGNRPCNPGGATPVFPLAGNAAVYGYYPAWATDTINAAGLGALAVALKADGTGPPSTWSASLFSGWDGSTSPVAYAFCPGNNVAFSYTNPLGVNARVWAVMQVTGGEPYYHDVTGGPYILTISDSLFVLPAPMVTLCQKCCNPVVNVTWTQVVTVGTPSGQPATSYTLSRQKDGTGGFQTIATTLQDDPRQYLDFDVVVGSTYEYHATATYQTTTSNPGDASITVTGFVGDAPIECTFTADAPISCTFTDPDTCTC